MRMVNGKVKIFGIVIEEPQLETFVKKSKKKKIKKKDKKKKKERGLIEWTGKYLAMEGYFTLSRYPEVESHHQYYI